MISIIIPTYNEFKNVSARLEYLSDKMQDGDELLLIDAALSTDELVKLETSDKVKVIKSKSTSRAKQLNEGALLAHNQILFFLHADVTPPKNFRKSILNCLSTRVDLGSFSYRFDSDRFVLKVNASFTKREGLFAGGGDQGLFLHKELFNRLGGYDESLLIMEDFDLYDRFKQAGYNYKILDNDAIVSARKYDSNSYLRVNLVQGIVFLKYKMGCSQESIYRFYKKWIR